MNRKYFKHIVLGALISSGLGFYGTNAQAALYATEFDSSWTQFAADDGPIGPGGGGQDFDAEYLLYKVVGTELWLGLQAGFDLEDGAVTYSGKDYYSGDLALSFDGDSTDYEYAFDFGLYTENYTAGNTIGGNTGTDGTDHAGLYNSLTWDNGVYPGYTDSNPFAMESGSVVSGALVSNSFGDNGGIAHDDLSYFRTIVLDLSVLNTALGHDWLSLGFDAHWTMSCGNDAIDGNVAPVPEPATMLLFGTGLIGLAGIARRRSNKK